MNTVGFFLAVVRLREPYVWTIFKQKCSIINTYPRPKDRFSNESLYSFLKSAMNIEYVYLILYGINKSVLQLSLENSKKGS